MGPEPRTAWTDERLDDMREELSALRVDMNAMRGEMNARFDQLAAEMARQIGRVDDRIDALQRTLITVGGGMIASILLGSAGIVATQL